MLMLSLYFNIPHAAHHVFRDTLRKSFEAKAESTEWLQLTSQASYDRDALQ